MRVNSIGVTTFGNRQQAIKKAMPLMGFAAGAVAGDMFVKGLSKPNADKEVYIRGNEDIDDCNPCDPICKSLCDTLFDD